MTINRRTPNTINRWRDVLKYAGIYSKQNKRTYWIFRAGKVDQELKSSLEEAFDLYDIAPEDKRRYERQVIREFQRKASLYIENEPDKDDILEWLAIMRHWDGAVRITDWTYSFYVAVYFALSEHKEGKIWAFNAALANKSDETINKIRQEGNFNYLRTIRRKIERKADLLGIRKDGHKLDDLAIACYFLSTESKPVCLVYAVNPFRLNKRLTIQQGLFLMSGDISCSLRDNMKGNFDEGVKSEEKNLIEIQVKPGKDGRKKILSKLKSMNISQEVLFPDLDGFARSLKERFAYPESFPYKRNRKDDNWWQAKEV